MEFFMSAEIEADVGQYERSARKKIEPLLIDFLSGVVLDSELKTWSFISIILSDKFAGWSPELIKFNKKDKEFDCRLRIEHERFKCANESRQIAMILDAIERSIEMMAKYKITKHDQEILRGVVSKVREKLLISGG